MTALSAGSSDPDVKALLTSGVVMPCYYAERLADRPDCEILGVVRYGPITLCADCDRRRSTVGKGTAAVRLPDPSALLALVRARQAFTEAECSLRRAVSSARRSGHPWSSLGAVLGTTRQAAQQRFAGATGDPSGKGGD